MSIINKEISDFKAYAFHENEFKTISKDDILGRWSVFFFYPADFTFICPTELEDLANKYEDFRSVGCEVNSVSTHTHIVHKAWHDASERIKKIKNTTETPKPQVTITQITQTINQQKLLRKEITNEKHKIQKL